MPPNFERQLSHPPAAVFAAYCQGVQLIVTDQVTSIAGQGPIDDSRAGYGAILDRLDRLDGHLAAAG